MQASTSVSYKSLIVRNFLLCGNTLNMRGSKTFAFFFSGEGDLTFTSVLACIVIIDCRAHINSFASRMKMETGPLMNMFVCGRLVPVATEK